MEKISMMAFMFLTIVGFAMGKTEPYFYLFNLTIIIFFGFLYIGSKIQGGN